MPDLEGRVTFFEGVHDNLEVVCVPCDMIRTGLNGDSISSTNRVSKNMFFSDPRTVGQTAFKVSSGKLHTSYWSKLLPPDIVAISARLTILDEKLQPVQAAHLKKSEKNERSRHLVVCSLQLWRVHSRLQEYSTTLRTP